MVIKCAYDKTTHFVGMYIVKSEIILRCHNYGCRTENKCFTKILMPFLFMCLLQFAVQAQFVELLYLPYASLVSNGTCASKRVFFL